MRKTRIVFYFDRIYKIDDVKNVKWQLKIINKNDVYDGNGVDEFFKIILNLKGNLILYTWELEYEGSYIEYYLSRQNYEYGTSKINKSFDNLENPEGKYYIINVKDENGRIIKFQSIHHKFGNINLDDAKLNFDINMDGEIHIIEALIKFAWENKLRGITCGMDSFLAYKNIIGKDKFNQLYPTITHEEDSYLRDAFKGGLVYLKENVTEEHFVSVYDINSAYGGILRDSQLPYGRGKYFKGKYENDPQYNLYVQRIRVKCKIKNGMIPFINIRKDLKNMTYSNTDAKGYLLGTNRAIELKLTNYEIDHLKINYIINSIEYIDGIKYRGSNQHFREYIDYYYNLKQKGGALGNLGKSMIINLYGKFASKEDRQIRRIYYDKEKDEIIKYNEDRIGKLIYLPVSVFVTSALRAKLLKVMESNHDLVIYSDTDCVHLREGKHKNINIGKNIGKFKLEAYCINAKYLGRKKYCYEAMIKRGEGKYHFDNQTKLKAVFSGVSMDKKNLKYDEFFEGNIIKSKYYNTVQGGTIIDYEYIVI